MGVFYAAGDVIEMESILLWDEPVALYAHDSHPLAQHTHVGIVDLESHDCIGGPLGSQLGKLIDSSLARVGLKKLRVAFRSGVTDTTLEALLLGLGYACGLETVVTRSDAAALGVRKLPFDLGSVQVRLAVQRKLRLDPVIRSLVGRLKSVR